jgi:hypothetical protein
VGLASRPVPDPQASPAPANAQLRELERPRVLVEASKRINSSIEPSVLFPSIVSIAREQLGVERGTLFFVDEAKGELRARIPAEGEVSEIRLPMGKGVAAALPVLRQEACRPLSPGVRKGAGGVCRRLFGLRAAPGRSRTRPVASSYGKKRYLARILLGSAVAASMTEA